MMPDAAGGSRDVQRGLSLEAAAAARWRPAVYYWRTGDWGAGGTGREGPVLFHHGLAMVMDGHEEENGGPTHASAAASLPPTLTLDTHPTTPTRACSRMLGTSSRRRSRRCTRRRGRGVTRRAPRRSCHGSLSPFGQRDTPRVRLFCVYRYVPQCLAHTYSVLHAQWRTWPATTHEGYFALNPNACQPSSQPSSSRGPLAGVSRVSRGVAF